MNGFISTCQTYNGKLDKNWNKQIKGIELISVRERGKKDLRIDMDNKNRRENSKVVSTAIKRQLDKYDAKWMFLSKNLLVIAPWVFKFIKGSVRAIVTWKIATRPKSAGDKYFVKIGSSNKGMKALIILATV